MPIALYDPSSLDDPRSDPNGWTPAIVVQVADGATMVRAKAARLLRNAFKLGGRCAVAYAEKNPWVMLGFAVVGSDANDVVWCWTRPVNRTDPAPGVMTQLLTFLGTTPARPIRAFFRSPAAEGIQRRLAKRGIVVRFADEERKDGKSSQGRVASV